VKKDQYNIIVIGAGHAGCEAAVAAARLGGHVLLITSDMAKIAQMSCNPAIGGIAKGQIVREIDALGGCTGIVTDASTIQFRMLNRSKGPAMWSPRAQCDKNIFSLQWRSLLETTSGLDLLNDTVTQFIFNGNDVVGVCTQLGASIFADAVVLTAGTFLNGRIHIGKQSVTGGRIGELSVDGLSKQLNERGLEVLRMKTGTPPRIDTRSVDVNKLAVQYGDADPLKFSFLPVASSVQNGAFQKPCYIVYTSKVVHEILRTGFKDSPLFSGRIKGIGPRYCPSIEDKLRTFVDRDQHQLFLEPEGWNTCEYYLQGFSSSLPMDIQLKALREIDGFENVRLFRPGYAVEYDYLPPTQLTHSLEVKSIPGLFMAGQVNGTTGYEEAAAQGLMAGINAVLKCKGKEPFVLKRDQAYIGVLIDDLVSKGVDEPYRMFTSRAEYRVLLRQDNADQRLTHISYKLGLASSERMKLLEAKKDYINELITFLSNESASPHQVNDYLEKVNSTKIDHRRRWVDLLSRPDIELSSCLELVSRETEDVTNGLLKKLSCLDTLLYTEIIESTGIEIKYKGYIVKEREFAQKMSRLEHVLLPLEFSYETLASLSTEARQKLTRIKPSSIGQASRIPGVSPADIAVLLIFFGR